MTWLSYAILSAVFAALTSILAKVGIEGVNSHLATAIRTVVVLVLSWVIVFGLGAQKGIKELTSRNWSFLLLSGVATGLSWICYYKALQMGDVSKVAPIDKLSIVLTMILAFVVLGETVSLKAVVGGVLITAGVLVLAL